jgi:hypothetical protein
MSLVVSMILVVAYGNVALPHSTSRNRPGILERCWHFGRAAKGLAAERERWRMGIL